MRAGVRVRWVLSVMVAIVGCGDGGDDPPIELLERERGDALEGRTFSFVQGDDLVTCDAGAGGCDELLFTLELGCVEEVARWRFGALADEGELDCFDEHCPGDEALRDGIAQQVHLCLAHRLQTMATVPLATDVCMDGAVALRDREVMEQYDPASGYTRCGAVLYTVQPESAQDRLTLAMLATQQAMESVHRGRGLLDTSGGTSAPHLEEVVPAGDSAHSPGTCPPDCGGVGYGETITVAELGVATLTEGVQLLHEVGLDSLPSMANADAMIQSAAAESERRSDAASRVHGALATQLVGYPRFIEEIGRTEFAGDDDLLCDELEAAGARTAELLARLGVQLDDPTADLVGVTVDAMRDDLSDWIAREGLEAASDDAILEAADVDPGTLDGARRRLLDQERLVGIPVLPDPERPGRVLRAVGSPSPVVAMANTIGRAQINHVHSVDEPMTGMPASDGYVACGGTTAWHYGRCGHLPDESVGAGGTVAAAMLEARGALARIVETADSFSDPAARDAVRIAASRGYGLVSRDVRGQARIATGKDLGDGADHLYVSVFGEKDVEIVWGEAGRVACSTGSSECARYRAAVTTEPAPLALEAGGHSEAVSLRVDSNAVLARCESAGCPHWTAEDVLYVFSGDEALFGFHPHPRPRISYSPGGAYTKFRPPSLQSIVFGPGLLAALAHLLPNADDCARPAYVCGDTRAPVALESIIDENECGADDVENAYECRLRAFERAAAESDAACMQVIESGLDSDRRAESAREQLELACGGVVVDTWTDEPPSPCASNEDCGEGAECVGGYCLGELGIEEAAALRECLGAGGSAERLDVALGQEDVCFFVPPGGDPCECDGLDCPRACPVHVEGECTRDAFLRANEELPNDWGGDYEFRSTDGALGLVATSSHDGDSQVTIRTCRSILRDLRSAAAPEERREAAAVVAAWARGVNFAAVAPRVNYEARHHHLGFVSRDGGLWLGSGSEADGAPDLEDDQTLCEAGADLMAGESRLMGPLYDARYDCSNPVERFRMNTRLFRAVATLHSLTAEPMETDLTNWSTSLTPHLGVPTPIAEDLYDRVAVRVVGRPRPFAWGEGHAARQELYWPGDPELSHLVVGALVASNPFTPPDATWENEWVHQHTWGSVVPDWLQAELGTGTSMSVRHWAGVALSHHVDGGDSLDHGRRALEVTGLAPVFGGPVPATPGWLQDAPDFFERGRLATPRAEVRIVAPSLRSVLADHANDASFQTHAIHGRDVFIPELVDALELACELDSPADEAEHDLDELPSVERLSDLPVASAYIARRAQLLHRTISARSLFDVPADAVADLSRAERVREGAYGNELAGLRVAMVDLTRAERQLLDQVRGARSTVDRAIAAIRMEEAQRDVNAYGRAAEYVQQTLSCTLAVIRAFEVGLSDIVSGEPWAAAAAAGATCAASGTLATLTSLRGDAEDRRTGLAIELSLIEAGDRLHAHMEGMTRAAEEVDLALERIRTGIEGLRRTRAQAELALSRMLLADTDASGRQHAVNTVMRARHGRRQQACNAAHARAKALGWEARRAIEQHFAVDLADRELWNRTGSLGLLEPPPEWADALCGMNPVDYRHLRETGDFAASNPSSIVTGLADGFVGDYARLLRDFTRGYRGAVALGDGRAVGSIALADQVFETAGVCLLASHNLLPWSARLDQVGDAGWFGICPDPESSCVSVRPLDEVPYAAPAATLGAPLGRASAYELAAQPGGYWATTTAVPVSGRHWLSWYERDDEGDAVSRVVVALGSNSGAASLGERVEVTERGFAALGWRRHAIVVDVPEAERLDVHLSFEDDVDVRVIGAVQLEAMVDAAGPRRFVATGADAEGPAGAYLGCPDADSARFRADHVDYVCDWDGRCFHEIEFDVQDDDLQGRLRQSGVHPGFFNYRVHSMAMHLVQRDQLLRCEDEGWSCYARDRYPYELRHDASTVRNHEDEQYSVPLAPMSILSDASVGSYVRDERDPELVWHSDLRGRPLQGRWRMRIEDDGRFDVSELRDVQMVVQYSYWNRGD